MDLLLLIFEIKVVNCMFNEEEIIMKPSLDFVKLVLEKVSFDKNLFVKELKKSIEWLSQQEQSILYRWCLQQFGSKYGSDIQEVFFGGA